ncbi:NAD(P)H-dependent oxidoreductase [Brucepastera parasyntrophica]|uniref:NAD(P)H-dependent oxidoreductase n=1 Tax=Brucepastera parasyntrophica TaxID=2880008 RepID=UPI00210B4BD7|nr:NAD(P)H-dependent oxidoreductase [Brucepastera parasyntrophica]ULQ58957.1 NAD(P)H-dependent oxidoreductase [Brucepastera parasyntrophica]
MKIAIINGSPKSGRNNSQYFADELENRLGTEVEYFHLKVSRPEIGEDVLKELSVCEALVLCFPLYGDGIPSHLLYVLQKIEQFYKNRTGQREKQKVYALINNGFFEGSQNSCALGMLRHWCSRAGLSWGQGIGIGAGEMLGNLPSVPMGYGPKKTPGKILAGFADNILNGNSAEDAFCSPDFPRFAFEMMGSSGWKKEAEKNGLRVRDLYSVPPL